MTGQPAPSREPVSIRFHAALAAAASQAAAFDGAGSVGDWVRGVVERELWRRAGKCHECGAERAAT